FNAVLLEVNYDSKAPWPVAPDGTGHSLILNRPSYGERDPRAWAASDKRGGSPGAADPRGPTSPVVINEILAHTESDDYTDYIELYNHSKQAVDLSGALITDGNTNIFRIPNGTTIVSNGFVSFNQFALGFAFQAAGDRAILIESNQTRVLDAVRFDAQANNVSSGRFPDGSETWRELATLSAGAANGFGGIKRRDIVINELMYSPISGKTEDEYVELYNRGANSINLGGWR